MEFCKGIKRDPALFQEYKHERQWDVFNRSLHAVARAQDVAEVLDVTFIPTPSNRPLFREKQKYMYSVFLRTVQTDQGKVFVREHQDDFDAQKVYAKLHDHAVSSLAASLESSRLLAYLTTAKLGADTWKGTATSFVLHWFEQLRLYHEVNSKSPLPDDLVRTLLQNAVHDFRPLRAVKDQADQFKTQNKKELTLQEYTQLLKSAAHNHDASITPKRPPLPRRRQVLEHSRYEAFLPS